MGRVRVGHVGASALSRILGIFPESRCAMKTGCNILHLTDATTALEWSAIACAGGELRRGLLGSTVLLFTMVSASSSAIATSVCVTCDTPDATYSCSAAPVVGAEGAILNDKQLQFSCIQDIARSYQHATCRVKRNQLGTCMGQVHMVAASTTAIVERRPEVGLQTFGPPPATKPADAAAPVTRTPNTGNEPAEPKTVVELAKRTVKSTEKQIDKSADTVTEAARTTWRCLSTLFAKC